MSFEEYIRTTQLPAAGSPRTKILAPTRSATARTAGGGVAAIRPKGQTPFDAFIQAVEELPVDEETPAAPVDDAPVVDAPGWPGADDVRADSGVPVTGAPPETGERGVDDNGNIVGTPPRGGHGGTFDIGGGAGAGRGDGRSGFFYACGEQIGTELGLGEISPGAVSPPRLVPGLPAVEQVASSGAVTLAISADRGLLVAGEGSPTGTEVLAPAAPELHAPSVEAPTGYVPFGSIQSSPTAPLTVLGELAGGVTGTTQAGLGYFQTFTLSNPAKISGIILQTVTAQGTPTNSAGNPIFTMKLLKGAISDVIANPIELCELKNGKNEEPGVRDFKIVGGGDIDLERGSYTAFVRFQTAENDSGVNTGYLAGFLKRYRNSYYSTARVYSGSGNVFPTVSRMAELSVSVSDAGGEYSVFMQPYSGLGDVAIARRLSSPLTVDVGDGLSAVSVRAFLRGVTEDGDISATVFNGAGEEVARGVAKLRAQNFPGTVGHVDINLGAPLPNGGYSVTFDAFGARFEIGTIVSPGQRMSGVSSTGAFFDAEILNDRRVATAVFRASGDLEKVPAFGRNFGLATAEQFLTRFQSAAEDVGFSRRASFFISTEGSVVGGRSAYSAGLTPLKDSASWSLVLDPPGLDLLASSPDGAVLALRYGRVFGLGDSSNGRLGFPGSSEALRESQAPVFVDRGALNAMNGVLRDTGGRLYGAGRGLDVGWNPIPQVGLQPAQNPAFSSSFQLIRAEPTAIDSWDLGGDVSASFLLASDASGLYATGSLPGVFHLDAWTLLDPREFAWIRCGARHVLLVTADGDLYALGDNSHGQLGLPMSTTSVAAPTFVGGGIARAFASENKTFIIAA